MGNRLSKIYTRTGDAGETGLGDGSRVNKDSARVEAYGCVDELNSCIGVVIEADRQAPAVPYLQAVQHRLFDLGAELCVPGHEVLVEEDVRWLEAVLDYFNQSMPPLKEFILPAGSLPAAYCHVARTVCRRSERALVTLSREETLPPFAMSFVNRLSDLLFVLCRVYARAVSEQEPAWQARRELPYPPAEGSAQG